MLTVKSVFSVAFAIVVLRCLLLAECLHSGLDIRYIGFTSCDG